MDFEWLGSARESPVDPATGSTDWSRYFLILPFSL